MICIKIWKDYHEELFKIAAVASSLALILSACTIDNNQKTSTTNNSIASDNCTPLVVATSSEKVNLLQELGDSFKKPPEMSALPKCVTVYPINVSSGKGAEILSAAPKEWPALSEDQWPTIWSPASTMWTDRITALGNGYLVEGVAADSIKATTDAESTILTELGVK